MSDAQGRLVNDREPGLRCSPAWVSSSRERRIGKRFRAEVDYDLFHERELVGSSWAFEFNLMPRLRMRLCWKSWRTFDCKSIDIIEVTRDVQLIVRAGPSDCLADIWSCSEDEDDWRCAGHDL